MPRGQRGCGCSFTTAEFTGELLDFFLCDEHRKNPVETIRMYDTVKDIMDQVNKIHNEDG